MSATKRKATTSAVKLELVESKSIANPSVTMLSLPQVQLDEQESPKRSSKRVKVENNESVPENVASTLKAGKRTTRRAVKLEQTKEEREEAIEDLVRSPSTKKRKATSASPRKPKQGYKDSLTTPHPAPPHWEEVYDLIHDMRSTMIAPVDTMGCDQAHRAEDDPKDQRFTTLVSLMLSSQTKDEVTDAAIKSLRSSLNGPISIQTILSLPNPEQTISQAIAKVGFWRRKTTYIIATAKKLQEEFGGDVPKTAEELCSLPGVGPKMAFLALQVAWGLNLGIGVDVHVHRITNRLGWHKPPTKDPEETRVNLESWLPKPLHPKINHMLVGFGQVLCTPVRPKCEECTVAKAGLCPSASISKTKTTKKVKTEVKAQVEVELETEG